MDTEYNYKQEIQAHLKLARKRLSNIENKKNLLASPEGEFLQEYIDNRASYIISQITSKTPLSDRDYLSAHGSVREIHKLREVLSAEEDPAKVQEEIATYEQQLRDL